MKPEFFIYLIGLLISIFAISGVNFEPFIKKNHVWEARFLAIILIFGLAYLFGTFFVTILEYIK